MGWRAIATALSVSAVVAPAAGGEAGQAEVARTLDLVEKVCFADLPEFENHARVAGETGLIPLESGEAGIFVYGNPDGDGFVAVRGAQRLIGIAVEPAVCVASLPDIPVDLAKDGLAAEIEGRYGNISVDYLSRFALGEAMWNVSLPGGDRVKLHLIEGDGTEPPAINVFADPSLWGSLW